MPALGKYPAEVRDRAVRMVNEKLINEPALAVSTAWRLVGEQVAINRNTLRNWVKQHHVDSGKAPGMASDDKQRIMVTCPRGWVQMLCESSVSVCWVYCRA